MAYTSVHFPNQRKVAMKSFPLIAPLLLALLTGCSTTIELNKMATRAGPKIIIKDNRPVAERVHFRESVQAPVSFFGDTDFSAAPLDHFSALLNSKLPPGLYDLEITKFRVMDIFPERQGSATVGALSGVLGSMGYSVYLHGNSSQVRDNITCLVGGTLQAKPISAAATVPYHISPLAGMVRSDPSYRSAVNECFSKLAEAVSKTI